MDKDNKNVWNLVVISIGIIAAVIASLIIAKDIIFKGSNTHKLSSVYKYTIATNEKAVELDNMSVKLESYIYSQKFGIGYCIFDVKLKNKDNVKVINKELSVGNTRYGNTVFSDGKNTYNLMFLGSGSMNSEYEMTDTGYRVYIYFNVNEFRKGKEDMLYIMGNNDSYEYDNISYTESFTLMDKGIKDVKYKTDKCTLNINLLGASVSGVISEFTIAYKNGDKDKIMFNGNIQGKNYYSSHNSKKTIVFGNPCDVKNIEHILVDGVEYK